MGQSIEEAKEKDANRFVTQVYVKQRLTLNQLHNLLYRDNYNYSRNAGIMLLVAANAPIYFCRKMQSIGVSITKRELRVLTAISFACAELPTCTRQTLYDMLPMEQMSIGLDVKRLVQRGYILEREHGKKFGLCLSVDGHDILMQYFSFSLEYQERLLSQDFQTK
ncbi:MAG TPA: hypothetical protein PLJ00_05765 [Chitinophagales bacterium]|nr:hypothetical protein [Chitinophagales bacterium]